MLLDNGVDVHAIDEVSICTSALNTGIQVYYEVSLRICERLNNMKSFSIVSTACCVVSISIVLLYTSTLNMLYTITC